MNGGHKLISFVEDRLGHDFRYSVNTSKINALGWKPQFRFSEGIMQTTEWYKINQWFLK
jgi:dTDP-glucose 4,6-dehydratase